MPTPKSGWRTSGDRKLMAKKPRTIVGMPAIVSRTGLTTFRTRFEEYSDEQDRGQQSERDRR